MSATVNYKSVCEQVRSVAEEAGSYIFSQMNKLHPGDIESKGKQNFVTEVDKAAEAMIISRLAPLAVNAGFIAEEGTARSEGERLTWVIDPLDGTTNFIHGANPVSVSIALLENGEPVIGVVHEIWLKESFYTWKGGDAFLNGNRIHVSTVEHINESLIATGFPYTVFNRLENFMKSLDYFFNNTHGVRRLGSAAADLAYVACGRYDGFYEFNLNPWDVAAGAFLVKQAGGMVADFSGGDDYLFGGEIVASNSHIFRSFREIVGNFMTRQA